MPFSWYFIVMSTHEDEQSDPEVSQAELVLHCPMIVAPYESSTPLGAATVAEYLVALLGKLWREGADFDSKRPYSGRSDWSDDVYRALAAKGLVEHSFDEEGYFEELDEESANELVEQAISALGFVKK